MARLPRLTVPGYPHHVIQRGNNRQAVFMDDDDRLLFLSLLKTHAALHKVAVNAYVLMGNHFHLLLTPETPEGIGRTMQAVGRAYVRGFNNRHGRSGTLWEGRFRSTVIEAERYLLACMAYIDLNPVRAGLVARAVDYPWSSHALLTGQRTDGWVTPHPLYWQLGNTPFAREQAYADLVQGALGSEPVTELSRHVHTSWALGGADFIADLEKRTQRRVARAPMGRPPKGRSQKNSQG
ncbi:MAG: transposase [Pseudomonadota bacterium]|nr:transposase [Pseudomonadota bacterium]